MKLRAKIILAFGLTVLGMVALAHWASQWIVMQGYTEVESRAMATQLARVANELRHEGERLGSVAHDYSRWDELYAFAEDRNPDFIATNLTDSTLVNLRLNLILIYDRHGELVASHAVNWRQQVPSHVSPILLSALSTNPTLLQQENIARVSAGLLNLPECPLLLAAAPLTTSRGAGPAHGTIVMGRWLNPQEVTELGKHLGAELLLFPRSAALSTRSHAVATQLAAGNSTVIENDGRNHHTGYMKLPDIFGNPSLIARIDAPRLIYMQGQASQRYLVAALFVSGAACAIAVWCAVYWFILRRLAKIQAAVVTVGATQQLGQRVELTGRDELAELATAINATWDAVRTAEIARRQIDERLRQVVDSIEDVVWSMDPLAQQVLFVSPSVTAIFGVHPAAALASRGPWQLQVVADDAERVQRSFNALRDGGTLDLKYRICCPDGEVRQVHNRARLIVDTHGIPLRIDGICTDITESQRLTVELKKAHQKIISDAHQAGKAEIATSVLHNVGNALNGVNVSAAVLHSVLRKSVATDFRRVLGLLAEQADRLTDFIDRDPRGRGIPEFIRLALPLLDGERSQLVHEVGELHTKVEHIKTIIQAQQENARSLLFVEITSVPEIVDETLRICGDRLTTHGVHLTTQLDFQPSLRVAKSQLVQILVNLVNNAIDAVKGNACQEKSVTIVSRSEGNGSVALEVGDSGAGIDPQNLTRIFNHGFTTKPDGHGFGLHYCALSMTSIGGKIQVFSDGLGHGSKFVVTFPALHAANHTSPRTNSTAIETQPTSLPMLLMPEEPAEGTPVGQW